ncbi:MAG: tetraacyldisaccharide 4'-kinase [Candidatus Hydrogenedentes bacterium]|nr:tetraacyldisaccharide 4'-kinase [Candidatus Hydrogenedentota bacterium]
MNTRDSLTDKIRRGAPLPLPLDLALRAATPITRIGMWHRGRQPRTRVDARVVSYGNITAGGTGKTPAVIARVLQESTAGKKVAVLTRGYGSAPSKTPLAARGVDAPADMAARFGDEPALIARRAPEAHIVKCSDRVAAAAYAVESLGCDILVLDDGFQYLRLQRDENIVLIDATNPFGGGLLLPRGLLREPLSGLERATEVILTRCDQCSDVTGIVGAIRRWNSDALIRRTWHAPTGLWRVCDGATAPLEVLKGRTIHAASAIGNPQAFRRTLEGAGALVADHYRERDHGHLDFTKLGDQSDAWIVVTEKDAVRMKSPPENVYALSVELQEYPE